MESMRWYGLYSVDPKSGMDDDNKTLLSVYPLTETGLELTKKLLENVKNQLNDSMTIVVGTDELQFVLEEMSSDWVREFLYHTHVVTQGKALGPNF